MGSSVLPIRCCMYNFSLFNRHTFLSIHIYIFKKDLKLHSTVCFLVYLQTHFQAQCLVKTFRRRREIQT